MLIACDFTMCIVTMPKAFSLQHNLANNSFPFIGYKNDKQIPVR